MAESWLDSAFGPPTYAVESHVRIRVDSGTSGAKPTTAGRLDLDTPPYLDRVAQDEGDFVAAGLS